MCLVATGAAAWCLDGRAGPHGLFVSGGIDIGLLAITGILTLGCALLARRIALAPRTTLTT